MKLTEFCFKKEKFDPNRMSFNNLDLVQAFPACVRNDALRVAATLPQPSRNSETFSVRVGDEKVLIPNRVYHDIALINPDGLTPLQGELLDCLLTRHHNGFVREKHLKSIVCSEHKWVPPFVVQLVGEYVIEILETIRSNLKNLPAQVYREFLTDNPAFLALTKQRVFSYWDCYQRHQRGEDYAGFQIVGVFDSLVSEVVLPQN
jgi:hypothetical protein